MKILRLSYHHLPPHLQACFRYCSMFHEDYEFTKDNLIKLWMGSGLIQLSVDEDQTPEDVGEHYLGILVRKSFFKIWSADTSNISNHGEFSHECYVIHDLLHELGRTVSKRECIRISSNDYGSIPRTVRHAIITIENHRPFTDFFALKKLRTLVISFDKTIKKRHQWVLLESVLKVATKLRVLRVSRSSLFKLPDAFGNLAHLRYLYHRGPVKEVAKDSFWCPCSIYKLYHLQLIDLNRCLLLPWRLGNLVSLRYLYVTVTGRQFGNPTSIGHLTSLQELGLNVPHHYGFVARELEHLKGLRHLYASGLENVNAREATLAKLCEKENLIMLLLAWNSGQLEADTEEQVLNSLQPHMNHAKLKIEGYNGIRSPYWMENPMITNLTYIALSYCNNWQHLPPLGRLPSLRYLYLTDMNAVKRIEGSFYGREGTFAFPSLKLLSVEGLPSLEEWVEVEGMIMFPRLEELCIRRCRVLRNIPALPSSLAYLEIFDVGLSTLPATYHSSETTVPQKSLRSRLKIYSCSNLVTLGQEYCFLYLEELDIRYCKNLLHLPMDRLQTLPLLKSLRVLGCPKLMAPQADINLSSSIRELCIGQCGLYSTCLLNSLCRLTCLTTLCLDDCATTAARLEDISLRRQYQHWILVHVVLMRLVYSLLCAASLLLVLCA